MKRKKTEREATDFDAIRADLQAIIKSMEEIRRNLEEAGARSEALKTEKR